MQLDHRPPSKITQKNLRLSPRDKAKTAFWLLYTATMLTAAVLTWRCIN